MELSKYEKETIIIFNEAEKTASVNTYNQSLIRQLRDYNKKSPANYVINKDGEQYIECTVPKSMIKIKYPRNFTDEQRAKMSERMRAIRERADDED